MKLKKILSGLIAIQLAIFSGMIFANNIYTESKLNITVSANSPQFMIKLKSNPTTGYSWFLRKYDASLITPLEHHYVKPDTKLIGAPGYETWTFKMKPAAFTVPHQTSIHLIYARPWQSDEKATQMVFWVST